LVGRSGPLIVHLRSGSRSLPREAPLPNVDLPARRGRDRRVQLGPIDVWVNNAMVTVFARPRRGHDRRGRCRAPVPGHPAPVALLRREARDPGLADHAPARLEPNKMGKRPQPVPPTFQPEMAASAIVWASQHRHLARTGYESQLTDEPDDDARADNLLEPVDAETDRACTAASTTGRATATRRPGSRPIAAWRRPPLRPPAPPRSPGPRAGDEPSAAAPGRGSRPDLEPGDRRPCVPEYRRSGCLVGAGRRSIRGVSSGRVERHSAPFACVICRIRTLLQHLVTHV
jgi:hypothetical protein